MTHTRIRRVVRTVRRAGFVAGILIAGMAILAWRIPTGTGIAGTDLMLVATPTGELGVTPVGLILSATGLRPSREGSGADGSVSVRNQTGKTLTVRARALPDSSWLDRDLMLRLTVGGDEVFRGTLGELRARTRAGFSLAPGQQKVVAVLAWIPIGATDGYKGVVATVNLDFEASWTG